MLESSMFDLETKLEVGNGVLFKCDSCKSVKVKVFKKFSKHRRLIGM